MEKLNWIETIKEVEVNEKGEQVVKKITLEPEKPKRKILGFDIVEAVDLLVKLGTLAAIILSALSFYNSISIIDYQKMADLEKFNLEKKYEAVYEVKNAFSEISENYTLMIRGKKELNFDTISTQIYNCRKVLRNYSIFFDEKDLKSINHCLSFYVCLEELPLQNWKDYANLFVKVNYNFRIICMSNLGMKNEGKIIPFKGLPEEGHGPLNCIQILNLNADLNK